MNTVLVTGATGYLGRQLALRLAGDGNIVHALYRSEAKLEGLQHKNIYPYRGTLTDAESINSAMQGCSQVYHLAALASAWTRNSRVFYDENVGGTENVLKVAEKQGVKKLVFTSSAGVLGPSSTDPNTEEKQFEAKHFTHYDRSKAMSENLVMEYVDKGLPAIVVNPTRIFGPGSMSTSNATTMMIDRYILGKWKIIPGDGESIGNYVFVEDVVNCHLLVMEKGRIGERYLAGGENLSFNEFFARLALVSGVQQKMYRLPVSLMMSAARMMLGTAWLTGWSPPIIPAFVRRYNHNWKISDKKARKELGYEPLSFEEGLKETIDWLGHKIPGISYKPGTG